MSYISYPALDPDNAILLNLEQQPSQDDIHESFLKNPASLRRLMEKLEDRIAKGEVG